MILPTLNLATALRACVPLMHGERQPLDGVALTTVAGSNAVTLTATDGVGLLAFTMRDTGGCLEPIDSHRLIPAPAVLALLALLDSLGPTTTRLDIGDGAAMEFAANGYVISAPWGVALPRASFDKVLATDAEPVYLATETGDELRARLATATKSMVVIGRQHYDAERLATLIEHIDAAANTRVVVGGSGALHLSGDNWRGMLMRLDLDAKERKQ